MAAEWPREFRQPMSERLTDGEWQRMLAEGRAPPPMRISWRVTVCSYSRAPWKSFNPSLPSETIPLPGSALRFARHDR